MTNLCTYAGISRQGFYKFNRVRVKREINEQMIVKLVKKIRNKHPRMGSRKLLRKLKVIFFKSGIRIGRDRFIEILRRNKLLIKRPRKWIRTTNSRHNFPVYKNIIKEMEISHSNQVWVGDITYIKTFEGNLYLSLIMDAFSRKIVGYKVNDTLEAEGCLESLEMAFKQLPSGISPIHHSDRGIQYCCKDYIAMLKSRNCLISMTEENHCYENSKAERVNGILKGEYFLGQKFLNKSIAKVSVKQAIWLYNNDRPHLSLEMKTPEMVHSNSKYWINKECN